MRYEKEIFFNYKGGRDYVQGPDIYDNMLKTVKQCLQDYPTLIKGSFHRPLRNNGILLICSELSEIDPNKSYANFSIEMNRRTYQVALYRSDSLITSSYDYDESRVIDNMTTEKEAARMAAKSSFTYIEQIVAMNKSLHLTLYPDAKKKWLFTKIDIKDMIDPSIFPGRELTIRVIKNFHNKLTQSGILLDNKLLGNVWFSQAS